MLQNTFIHLCGVGETTERKLWASGIRSWPDLLEAGRGDVPKGVRLEILKPDLEASIEQHARSNWRFFDDLLPAHHKWRAYADFGDRALYVDIETTGFGDEITVIGVYDGHEARTYVEGRDLERAVEDIERAPLVVTFNGACFDMPIIRRRFAYHLFNHIHIDLMYPLRKLGYKGGLKRIEEMTGLARSDGTRGLTGWDAVRLWRDYQHGRQEALNLLLQYNEEDIRNLKPLMEMVYREHAHRLPAFPGGVRSEGETEDVTRSGTPRDPRIPPGWIPGQNRR